MCVNYIKELKGEYIRKYLNYYLILNNLIVKTYDWGYKINAVTKLNDFNININVENDNRRVEELCDIALSNIKMKSSSNTLTHTCR